MQSALYEGWLRHRRHSPKAHAFTYRLCMLWLDLDEVDQVFAGRWLWSTHRPALARWCRGDHLGDPSRPLIEAVRDEVQRQSGVRPAGPVRLLTHPRYFGYGFNPASFYYCFGADGQALEAVVAEVTNTPWGERHAYVLPMASNLGRPQRPSFRFPKVMHVSPFLPMDIDYRCRLTLPGERLGVHMEDVQGERTLLDATLMLERRPIDGANLARALVRYPFMTGQVMLDIHWQALRLWLKGTPIYDHPAATPSDRERTA
jgi:DUF1365 family protein